MPDEQVPSPNGTPVLPKQVVPVLIAVGAIATAVVAIAPAHTIVGKVALGVIGLLSLFGISSSGWRR